MRTTWTMALLMLLLGCRQTQELPPLPIAEFTFSEQTVYTGEPVQFLNLSRHADRYEWDFGDGTVSDGPNPLHAFLLPGRYTVVLRAENESGSSEFSQELAVYVEVVAAFSFTPSSGILVGEVVQFDNQSQYALAYFWDFGDGMTSRETSPTHAYSAEGAYQVTLLATGPGGQGERSAVVNVEMP